MDEATNQRRVPRADNEPRAASTVCALRNDAHCRAGILNASDRRRQILIIHVISQLARFTARGTNTNAGVWDLLDTATVFTDIPPKAER